MIVAKQNLIRSAIIVAVAAAAIVAVAAWAVRTARVLFVSSSVPRRIWSSSRVATKRMCGLRCADRSTASHERRSVETRRSA